MSNSMQEHKLSGRSATRSLVAFSLALSLAAFGCTTDRHLGNGDPVTTPGVRTSPTSGASTGSETEPVPPPMLSSSRYDAAVVNRPQRLSAAEAAAIMADNQPAVRVLGPASPGLPGQPYFSDGRTNTFSWPAYQTNPQLSVNSSISSSPVPVITSGAGEGAAASSSFAGALVNGGVAAGTGTNTVNTGAAVISATNPGALTPTGAATALPAGAFAATTLSPTAASVVNPPASISGSPAVAAALTNNAARATGTTTTVAPATVTGTPGAATVVAPVRLTTGANGRPVITNVTATTTTTNTSSRSQ